jgi:hypothetical protein
MLKASGREKEGWIDLESIKKFSCEDLQTIDRLWVHYSNGLYGFSVQKDIYVECGGKLDFSYPSKETWEKFCHRTALKSEDKWVDYPDLFFKDNFMSVKGHLPFFDLGRVRDLGRGWSRDYAWRARAERTSFLASRLVKCKA